MTYPETGFSSPSLIDGMNAQRPYVYGLALPASGTPFLPGAHSGRQNPAEYDWPTPGQQLAAITEFIDTTTRLSATQLQWLAFSERWNEPSKSPTANERRRLAEHHKLDLQIEETIKTNVLLLSEALMQLTQQGFPLKIGHPQTGQSVPVVGMLYSTEPIGYKAAIAGSAPATPDFVPLFSSDQLHL